MTGRVKPGMTKFRAVTATTLTILGVGFAAGWLTGAI